MSQRRAIQGRVSSTIIESAARHHEPENPGSIKQQAGFPTRGHCKYFVPASTIRAFLPTEYRH